MAPTYMDLAAWGAADLPGLAVLSILVLFVLSITLLVLCTTCQRQRFELNHSAPVERDSSNSVRVVSLETAGEARDNPTMNYPERNHTVLPEDLSAVLGPNQEIKPWRNHTFVRNPEKQTNGVVLPKNVKGSNVPRGYDTEAPPPHLAVRS